MKEYTVKSKEETKEIATSIARKIGVGNAILLTGTLGAGKTFFTSCLINEILKNQGLNEVDVQSPTFSILKTYKTNSFPIHHFDLYRIKKAEELYELDIENCLENGLCIIEWPEAAESILYNIWAEIDIKVLKNENRLFRIKYNI